MPVAGDVLRRVMGRFATGVTVVTILDDEGNPQGFTANSLTSVSLDPPLVLVCVEHGVRSRPCFRRDRVFAVNILGEDQEDLSRKFASKMEDKFGDVSYRPGELGPPRLDGCIGYLECRILYEYPGGDHAIFVGQVEAARCAGDKNPLLFYGGKYARL